MITALAIQYYVYHTEIPHENLSDKIKKRNAGGDADEDVEEEEDDKKKKKVQKKEKKDKDRVSASNKNDNFYEGKPAKGKPIDSSDSAHKSTNTEVTGRDPTRRSTLKKSMDTGKTSLVDPSVSKGRPGDSGKMKKGVDEGDSSHKDTQTPKNSRIKAHKDSQTIKKLP